MEDNTSLWLLSPTKKMKWWENILRLCLSFILGFFLIGLMKSVKQSEAKKKAIRHRLRYFNPTIKKDWWGDEKIEWVGRDKPLTDEELDKICDS